MTRKSKSTKKKTKTKRTAAKPRKSQKLLLAKLRAALAEAQSARAELARVTRDRDVLARVADDAAANGRDHARAADRAMRERDEALREKVDSEAKLHALQAEQTCANCGHPAAWHDRREGIASSPCVGLQPEDVFHCPCEAFVSVAPSAQPLGAIRAPTVLPLPSPRAKAYLMVHLDLATLKVDDAMIFSEPAPIIHRECWLPVRAFVDYAGAGTFGEAREHALRCIASNPSDAWLRAWVQKHDEETKGYAGSAGTAQAPLAPSAKWEGPIVRSYAGAPRERCTMCGGVIEPLDAYYDNGESLSHTRCLLRAPLAPDFATPAPHFVGLDDAAKATLHRDRGEEVKRYAAEGRCPRCGGQVDIKAGDGSLAGPAGKMRDSSNDVRRCTKCFWSCSELELQGARGALREEGGEGEGGQ